jgi:cytochrome c5
MGSLRSAIGNCQGGKYQVRRCGVKEQSNKLFTKNISVVLVVLVLITLIVGFIARDVGFEEDQANDPGRDVTAEERIKPVADVYTGEDGAAAIEEAAARTAPEQVVVSDDGPDGKVIYASACAACHATGAIGAPQPGSAAMAQRAEKGLDVLMQSALNGLNAMPARGGRSDLSDEQVRAVVEFMLQ